MTQTNIHERKAFHKRQRKGVVRGSTLRPLFQLFLSFPRSLRGNERSSEKQSVLKLIMFIKKSTLFCEATFQTKLFRFKSNFLLIFRPAGWLRFYKLPAIIAFAAITKGEITSVAPSDLAFWILFF